jgi:hypothetical protein
VASVAGGSARQEQGRGSPGQQKRPDYLGTALAGRVLSCGSLSEGSVAGRLLHPLPTGYVLDLKRTSPVDKAWKSLRASREVFGLENKSVSDTPSTGGEDTVEIDDKTGSDRRFENLVYSMVL